MRDNKFRSAERHGTQRSPIQLAVVVILVLAAPFVATIFVASIFYYYDFYKIFEITAVWVSLQSASIFALHNYIKEIFRDHPKIAFAALAGSAAILLYSAPILFVKIAGNGNAPPLENWFALDVPGAAEQGESFIIQAVLSRKVSRDHVIALIMDKARETGRRPETPEAMVVKTQPFMFAQLSAVGLTYDPKEARAKEFNGSTRDIEWKWTVRHEPAELLPIGGRKIPIVLTIQGSKTLGGPRVDITSITKIVEIRPTSEGTIRNLTSFLSANWQLIVAICAGLGLGGVFILRLIKPRRSTLIERPENPR